MDALQTEIKDIVAVGYLNGLFILARSIGLIGNLLYSPFWRFSFFRKENHSFFIF